MAASLLYKAKAGPNKGMEETLPQVPYTSSLKNKKKKNGHGASGKGATQCFTTFFNLIFPGG